MMNDGIDFTLVVKVLESMFAEMKGVYHITWTGYEE